MIIEKHHATGLQLAIELLNSKGAVELEPLRNALTQSLKADALSYSELFNKLVDMEARLTPLARKQAFLDAQCLQEDRISAIVDILFPSYNPFAEEAETPMRHPEREWWWNGASLESSSVDGSWIWLKVTSYVGGGEYDIFECQVPSDWLDLEDPKEVIHEWCLREAAKMNEKLKKERLNKAQAEMEMKKIQLSQLQNEIKSLKAEGEKS